VLTDNQIKFCEEYLIHGNGALAYKTAYNRVTKNNVAASCAHKLLIKADISEYLRKRRAEIADKLKITPEKVLASHARRAFFDPRKLLDPETGKLIALHRLPLDVAAVVTKIKVRTLKPKVFVDEQTGEETEMEQNIIEVEWDNGNTAREALSKVVGIYEEEHRQANKGLTTVADVIRKIRADIDGVNLGLPRDQKKNACPRAVTEDRHIYGHGSSGRR